MITFGVKCGIQLLPLACKPALIICTLNVFVATVTLVVIMGTET